MITISPLSIKKIRRFKSIRRGYGSLILFGGLILLSLAAELVISNRALVVRYEGKFFFPTYGDMIPGTVFGLDYAYETSYRQLAERFAGEKSGNWVLMPPVPYSPYENDFIAGHYPPYPPSLARKHFLGTDTAGRDVLARLVYGFRIAVFFSFALLAASYVVGVALGSAMGYWGGKFDLFVQRLIEIWSNMPLLYVIIIISSVVVPSFFMLLFIMVTFDWAGRTWIMRTVTYREKERDYVLAARSLRTHRGQLDLVR